MERGHQEDGYSGYSMSGMGRQRLGWSDCM